MVHARQVGDQTLTFIVSGKLWRNSLVMQDEQTGSLWSHITGEALDGQLQGRHLEQLPSVQTTWSEWLREHPDSDVLRKEVAIRSSHYASYFEDPERTGMFRSEWLRERLPGKSKVHGLTHGPFALAVTDERLSFGEVVNSVLADEPLVVYRTADGGVRAFVARAGDTVLRFRRAEGAGESGAIRDEQTESVWDLTTGVCREGELAGSALEELLVRTAYWFAWSSFYPNTEVLD